jgi:diaminopropionate ammonia-lyase
MTQNSTILDPRKPAAFWEACHVSPAYKPSPLTTVSLGEISILVKDETDRMGLGAFKALGGMYAVGQLILEQTNDLGPADLLTDAGRAIAKDMIFVCASAGNHGMAVATGAAIFGAKSRIHLADTVPQDFANRLEAKGAVVIRSGATYEDSIVAAIKDAEDIGGIHLADGSWPGYTHPPRLVMEGYTVIAEEMRVAFEASGNWPSHVYLQAGVGGLAAGIAYMIRSNWSVQPEIIVVEPDAAPCLASSVKAGEMQTVAGPVSNMGRLDCKTPSMLAYGVLRDAADCYVSITDEQALDGVAVAKSLGFETTPSGVAGLAALMLEADKGSRPLVVLSEGAVADA